MEYHYGSAWADDSTDAWDSAGSWDSDDDGCERILAPFPIECLPPATWQPILGNLTRLNLTLAAGCCKFASLEDDSIVSRDEGLEEYASRKIKQIMSFYDPYLSSTVAVHRRVGCWFRDMPSHRGPLVRRGGPGFFPFLPCLASWPNG